MLVIARWLVALIVPCLFLLSSAQAGDAEEVSQLIQALRLNVDERAVSAQAGWREPERIVVRYADKERLAWLSEVAPGVELIAAASADEAISLSGNVQGVIGHCSAELLEIAHQLHWVQLMSAGAEYCVNVPTLSSRNILVTNMQHAASAPIAEHVIAMMMALSRGLNHFILQQQQAQWDRELVPRGEMWELTGKTMLVVGLGGIGTEVAKRAHALGMTVLATRNSSREGPKFVSYVGLADELEELIKKADVVVNATPLTPATEGLFDARLFKLMPSHAFFINVGRGRSVVTEDLVTALNNGEIGGVGLDVTDPEPLPDGHPLWKLPNVIISPHTAAATDQGYERQWMIVRENLRRYVAGEPMLSVVDVERGY